MPSENKTSIEVIIMTGATGVGKSSLLYSLKDDLPIEIICADSRQIYQDMMIGAASPTAYEKNIFPHHFFNFLSPAKKYSAGEFASNVKKVVPEIKDRNNIPIIIGGTFFYIKSLLDGLAPEVPISEEVDSFVDHLALDVVYTKLFELDKKAALALDRQNSHRVRRALKYCLASGSSFSDALRTGGLWNIWDFHFYWIDMERKDLYEKINNRVKKMFRDGFIAEIQNLLKKGFSMKDPGFNTIGYKETLLHAEKKKIDLVYFSGEKLPEQADLEDEIARKTRHFAKRQLTWFRNERRLKKIDYFHSLSQISDKIKKIAAR